MCIFKTCKGLGLVFLFCCCISSIQAQQNDSAKHAKKRKLDHWSAAFTNNHTAYPFSSFTKLVTGTWHPGFEIGSGFNWSSKKKHDWYQEFKLGYFYHQFVQHGIPLYTNFGYRYKFNAHWRAQLGLGAGALFSIPDHQRYKLNSAGDYERIHNIRLQGMVVLNISAGYKFALQKDHPLEAFITYQQRLQTPYVPNYVPLLPYNSLMFGIKRDIHQ